MTWWKSRRFRYIAVTFRVLLLLLVTLRLVFLGFFSEVGGNLEVATSTILQTLFIGFKFDLRLVTLLLLPIGMLCYMPRFNLLTSTAMRHAARVYWGVAVLAVTLIYIMDFGHYNYLGVRINSTVYRFAEDAGISAQMMWESYPVVWITLGWLALSAAVVATLIRVERSTLDGQAVEVPKKHKAIAVFMVPLLTIYCLLGRTTDINIQNPVPLRWSDAFFSGNQAVGALGLNPVLFLYDTTGVKADDFDLDRVQEYYPLMVSYLGVQNPDPAQPHYDRLIEPQPHRLQYERTPNVVFIMLESLGASRVGYLGNALMPTPNLDRLAGESWMFKNFYVPVAGTAKTVWASITGIPDVTKEESATRNPLIASQRLVLNEMQDHNKLYFIGGSAGWANMSSLINQSINGVRLLQEGQWKSPVVDVWGISDLDLFKEADQILREQPRDKPFFAYIQTAGNHRPFTIPKNNDDFKVLELPEEEVAKHGFRSPAQFNAVRLLDYNIGRFMEMAEASGYLNDTIFVLFGDHNNRITSLPHMPAHEVLQLESTHVPGLIYAPGYLEPRVIEEVVSLVDMAPTVASLLGMPYRNTTLGRDIQMPVAEKDQARFIVIREGSFPILGMVTKEFLLRINHDGTGASLHRVNSETPEADVSKEFPEMTKHLSELALAIYESSRYQFYQNRAQEQVKLTARVH